MEWSGSFRPFILDERSPSTASSATGSARGSDAVPRQRRGGDPKGRPLTLRLGWWAK